jgi:hypothetical protein
MHRIHLARTPLLTSLVLVVGVLCLTAPVQAKTKIVSHWLDREITIDGEIDEWRDALTFVRSVDAFVAMFNDDESLYVCLYSQSPENAKQFAADGLRLKVEGGRNGDFVVLYPKGGDQGAQGVVELRIDRQRDPVTVAAGGETGIEVSVSQDGSFVYELKLPLAEHASHPWAPGLAAGDRFKLVIDNPQVDVLPDEPDRSRPRGQGSPVIPGQTGSIGGAGDPGWSGRVNTDDPFFNNRFVFLLKARVELAKRP